MNNEQIIYTTAVQEGVPSEVAVLMVQQAKVESANFKSNLFNESFNAYGMKIPSKRKSPYIRGVSPVNPPAIEGVGGYAAYRNLADSIKDLIHYFKFRDVDWNKIKTAQTYAGYLKSRGYYGPDQEVYTNMMLRYYNDAKTGIGKAINANQGITIATGLMVVTMFTFFILKTFRSKK